MSAVGRDLDREQLAALVCATLDRHGVHVVLSGGGAASIYAPNPYESMDLDFIQTGLTRRVDAAMRELGFRKERGRHWTHPDTDFWIEFPPGPVQIGDDVVHEFAERETPHGTLRILTPTDHPASLRSLRHDRALLPLALLERLSHRDGLLRPSRAWASTALPAAILLRRARPPRALGAGA